MKLWRLTYMNYDTEQEHTEVFFSRRREALARYEELVPSTVMDASNTVLRVDLIEPTFKDTISLLNRWVSVIRCVKDWDSDPRKVERTQEGDDDA